MAQSNAQIIFNESLDLMKEGKIGNTGRKIVITYEKNGEKVTEAVMEPEPIHTYATWKALGYYVKKGEKAIASFTIWNYTNGKKGEAAEEEQPEGLIKSGYYYMKKAAFFKTSQVEKAGAPAQEPAKEATPEPEPAREPEPAPEVKPEAKKAARKSDIQKAYEYIEKSAAKVVKNGGYEMPAGVHEGIAYITDGFQIIITSENVTNNEVEPVRAKWYNEMRKSTENYNNRGSLTISAKELKEGIKELKAGRRNAKVVYTTPEGITLNADYLYNAMIATGSNEFRYQGKKNPFIMENDKTFYLLLPVNMQQETPEGLSLIG